MGSSGRLAGTLIDMIQQLHTPTTQEVQWAATTTTFEDSSITEDAFNRWLDARDARIEAAAEQRGAVNALRSAADHLGNYGPITMSHREVYDYLNNRADRLEGDE